MKHLLTPRALRAGDRIAAVSLSWGGPGSYPDQYELGKRQLEQAFGVEVVDMPHSRRPAEWLWRNPQARAEDLMQAFEDSRIQGVFSTIGGDDSIRLLPHIQLDVIRRNPKVFMGYSDSTITHMACLKAGVRSYYGPSIMAGFGERGGLFPFTEESVRTALFEPRANWCLPQNTGPWVTEIVPFEEPVDSGRIRPREQPTEWHWLQGDGHVNGRLLGGCLEVLDFLRGTDFWPEPDCWQGAVLFLETSEDAPPPANVSYFLRSLAAMGLLQRLKGLLMGRPGGCRPERFADYDAAVLKVVRDEVGLDIPVVTQLDFGHTDPMWVLPQGAMIDINCNARKLVLAECATQPRA